MVALVLDIAALSHAGQRERGREPSLPGICSAFQRDDNGLTALVEFSPGARVLHVEVVGDGDVDLPEEGEEVDRVDDHFLDRVDSEVPEDVAELWEGKVPDPADDLDGHLEGEVAEEGVHLLEGLAGGQWIWLLL